jgi:ribonuclease HII
MISNPPVLMPHAGFLFGRPGISQGHGAVEHRLRRAVMEVETHLRAEGRRLDRIHVDGNQCPKMSGMKCHALVGGDGRDAAIASASILAKVTRDRLLLVLDEQYPQYEFAKHKGYPTPRHRELLVEFGACPEHRTSFAPVRAVLRAENFD